jgi:hypothetical protein
MQMCGFLEMRRDFLDRAPSDEYKEGAAKGGSRGAREAATLRM